MMDPNIGVFHYNRDNTRFAYLDEFYEDPSIIHRGVLGRDNDTSPPRHALLAHREQLADRRTALLIQSAVADSTSTCYMRSCGAFPNTPICLASASTRTGRR